MWREIILKLHSESIFAEPALPEQIEETEKTLGVALPNELKSLLLETNGISDKYGSGLIWSVERIKKENLSFRNDGVYADIYLPFDNLVFFADAGNGDLFAYIVIQNQIKTPEVFAWDHEDDRRRWIAPSLEKYLEGWLGGTISL